jgi:hypothetical protein
VGVRLLEVLCYRERAQRRETRLLDMLKFVHRWVGGSIYVVGVVHCSGLWNSPQLACPPGGRTYWRALMPLPPPPHTHTHTHMI